jgi:hypothetical protein
MLKKYPRCFKVRLSRKEASFAGIQWGFLKGVAEGGTLPSDPPYLQAVLFWDKFFNFNSLGWILGACACQFLKPLRKIKKH